MDRRSLVDIQAEARVMCRAMRRMLEKAKAAGIKRPYLFFEAESGVFVMDADHPGDSSDSSTHERQQAIVGEGNLCLPGIDWDTGAW